LIRGLMSDEEWACFEPFVTVRGAHSGRRPKDHRLVLDGIFWIARTGAQWRDLHEHFGKWSSVYRQFRRWTLPAEISAGEVSDYSGCGPLMEAEGPQPKVLLADRGYDSDHIRETLEEKGAAAVIPTRRNRKAQIPVDGYIYALRNRIERCFNKLKNARRLATRYEQTAASYLGFVQIAAIRLWTNQFVNRT